MTRSALPTTWKKALEAPATSPAAFNGIYQNYGHGTHAVAGEISGRNSLATFAGLPSKGVASPGSTLELTVKGTDKMDVILRDGNQVLDQTQCTFAWDAEDHALVVENTMKAGAKNGDHVSGAGIAWSCLRLIKGSDGALYQQAKIGGVVAAFFVIPLAGTEESWGRWEPAPAPASPAR